MYVVVDWEQWFFRRHCPTNKMNLSIKTKPVTAGADMSVFCAHTAVYVATIPDIPVAFAPTVTGSVFLCGYSDNFWDSADTLYIENVQNICKIIRTSFSDW